MMGDKINRDDDSLNINLGMFGEGLMDQFWAGSIMDRVGLFGSDSDTMLRGKNPPYYSQFDSLLLPFYRQGFRKRHVEKSLRK
ncbi:hypothetical protein YC2023_050695 [Brassica napus]